MFMLLSAVDSMQQVVKTAEKVGEQRMTEMMLMFIAAFLMVVPSDRRSC